MKICSLASGSRGNSLFVESEQSRILIDAGLSAAQIRERLNSINVDPRSIDGIVITHIHRDHVNGANPFSRQFNIPIYGHPDTLDELTLIFSGNKKITPWTGPVAIADLTLSELKSGIFYQTPWGNARPSWHLECPTMALKLLGDTHDIHTGGADLIFPHHEHAIAIGEAATGKPFANYWIHNELVMVEGKKASGEADQEQYTIRSLLEKGYSGREIRLWIISHRYNKPISFSQEKLDAARNAVSHLDDFVRKLHVCQTGEPHPGMAQMEYNLKHGFTEAMNDDFNTSKALAGR